MMTVICLDDYHTNDRAGRKATGLTALDARENDFDLMGVQMEALKEGDTGGWCGSKEFAVCLVGKVAQKLGPFETMECFG